tara:strand:+ start:1891 stop:2124 length:234 start_codon:yes stop_codon:yes gene_type:complete
MMMQKKSNFEKSNPISSSRVPKEHTEETPTGGSRCLSVLLRDESEDALLLVVSPSPASRLSLSLSLERERRSEVKNG